MMSRAMLIMVTGVFVVMGTYQFTVQYRMLGSDYGVAEKAWNTAAYTNATSAIESTAQKIMLEPTWAQNGNVHNETYEDGIATVFLTRAGDIITLNAISTVEDASVQIEAKYRYSTDNFFPESNSAMGIYSNNLSFNINGSAFSISGHDYHTDGTINTAGVSMPGIAVVHGENIGLINDSLNESQKSNITGSSGTPSLELIDYDPADVDASIAMLIAHADEIHTTDYIAQGAGSLGTLDDPKIIVVEGKLDVSNATGAGVLIIKPDGELDVRGNLDHYEGLIIVQGSARMVRGNIKVYGSMIFGGEDPELEIDIDLRGNVHMRYSSEVLEQIYAKLSGRFNGKMVLLGVYK